MALWAKAQQLPQDTIQQIRAIYSDHFPIEVRHFLAPYIEEKFWSEIEPVPENPQHEQYVTQLVTELILEMERKAQTLSTEDLFLTKLKLIEAAKMFRSRYSSNPMQLFSYVRQCLATEMKLIQAAGVDGPLGMVPFATTTGGAEVIHKLDILRRRTQESGEDLRRMEQEQEAFALSYHECTKLNAHLSQLSSQPNSQQNVLLEQKLRKQKEMMETMLNQKVSHRKFNPFKIINTIIKCVLGGGVDAIASSVGR